MKFQLNITGWYKENLGRNFHQFFNVEKIDYCDLMKTIDSIPWFKFFMNWADAHLPGIIKPCPFTGVSN
jgi:hypothetical protein